MLDSERLKDYAVLILCGCLFITRHSAFATFNSLMRFVMKYSLPGEDDHLSIFGKIAGQPSKCSLPHDGSFIKWNKVEHMKDVCNPCRWKAFKDAYELKRRIVSVYHLPQKMTQTTTPTTSNINILDLSDENLPFVNQTQLKDIKNSTLSLKFYSCKVHPMYIHVDPELRALDGVEIFRKVYRYQPLERQRIEDAKKEARIAFVMSRHKSVVPLLFAFSHDNRIYEVIELLYERKKGTLESLLLRGLLLPAELASIAGHRIELVDNVLWRAMIDIVEAVVDVHSLIESLNPLDIKPANILVGTNEKGEFALYLTDFGHIAEKTPRKAAIDYAPPLPNIGAGIGKESPTKYNVWSMACMLLQVLVFIDGKCNASELETFDMERQEGFKDAAFWTDEGGEIRLREPVFEMLKNLEKGRGGSRTFQVVEKIRKMFSIDPDARDTMEGCLEVFQNTKYSRWPEGQDHMVCGCEKWTVKYRIGRHGRRYPAKLAVYRDSKKADGILMPSEQRQQPGERITIELELGSDPPKQDENSCDLITFAPAAFWRTEQEDDREREDLGHEDMKTEGMEAVWFNGLHPTHTILFPRGDEYRKFVALVTRQEIKRKPLSNNTEFRIERCIINDHTSYIHGNVQLWHLLSEQEYDSRFGRTPLSPAAGRRPSFANIKPKGLTDWKLVFWMHHPSTKDRVCVVLDIGEKTWKLNDKPGSPQVIIKQMYLLPLKPKIRAAVFLQTVSERQRTLEEYPFIPIDALELQNALQEKVVNKMEMVFPSAEGKYMCGTSVCPSLIAA
ncbi:hypothetical protein CGLO_11765 [Colletotrichum gloeosporioides Cg-14]|uniref:Protein kinase domain-containing protein n=1 Tax=Colletotrichum gloeosporioides (strain Cg-14) TaxID=1237896 RepID=T0K009_COLGC|nr:hypothetical protein CGLO_11765 [Colletotrichum gloeosporioides Cg-14]